jgi:hypothetical protein
MTNRQIIQDALIKYNNAQEVYLANKKAYETANATLCPNAEAGYGHMFERVIEKEWSGPYRESFYVEKCTLCGYTV